MQRMPLITLSISNTYIMDKNKEKLHAFMLVGKFSTFFNNYLYNFGITKTKYLEHYHIV